MKIFHINHMNPVTEQSYKKAYHLLQENQSIPTIVTCLVGGRSSVCFAAIKDIEANNYNTLKSQLQIYLKSIITAVQCLSTQYSQTLIHVFNYAHVHKSKTW